MGILFMVVIFAILAIAAIVVVTVIRSRRKRLQEDIGVSAKSLDESVPKPEPVKKHEPPRKKSKPSPEVTEKTGLDEIGDRLNDIRATLKRLE
jgi:hypothetical protein